MIYWGQQAYKNLDALMVEMKDPAVVNAMFSKFDSNKNGGETLHHIHCSSIMAWDYTYGDAVALRREAGVYCGRDRPTQHGLVVA